MSFGTLCRCALSIGLALLVAPGCAKKPQQIDARDGAPRESRALDKGKVEGGGSGEAVAGSRQALVVGVTGYDNKAFGDLKYTENDAEGLAAALQKKEAGFRVRTLT